MLQNEQQLQAVWGSDNEELARNMSALQSRYSVSVFESVSCVFFVRLAHHRPLQSPVEQCQRALDTELAFGSIRGRMNTCIQTMLRHVFEPLLLRCGTQVHPQLARKLVLATMLRNSSVDHIEMPSNSLLNR